MHGVPACCGPAALLVSWARDQYREAQPDQARRVARTVGRQFLRIQPGRRSSRVDHAPTSCLTVVVSDSVKRPRLVCRRLPLAAPRWDGKCVGRVLSDTTVGGRGLAGRMYRSNTKHEPEAQGRKTRGRVARTRGRARGAEAVPLGPAEARPSSLPRTVQTHTSRGPATLERVRTTSSAV